MKRPNMLDVVHAVVRVAPDWPQVRVWWYAPTPRFRVAGGPAPGPEADAVQVVVELGADADLDALARALKAGLKNHPVRVSLAGEAGEADGRRFYRVLTSGAGYARRLAGA